MNSIYDPLEKWIIFVFLERTPSLSFPQKMMTEALLQLPAHVTISSAERCVRALDVLCLPLAADTKETLGSAD